ncbi:Uncharacterized protein PBTT_05794 [Plasmodiophora brassicae]|nr:hypothetical protein PBRA_007860 [Plasmodiophora brassicae]
MPTLAGCGRLCGSYSLFAAVFLLVLAYCMSAGQVEIEDEERRPHAATNLMIAGLLYVATWVASMACIWFGSKREQDLRSAELRADMILLGGQESGRSR